MKRRFVFGCFCLLAASVAFGHFIPVFPVDVTLTVDSDEIRAVVRTDADYMYEGILGIPRDPPLPGTGWPKELEEHARVYVESCLTLSADGHPLSPSRFEPRFVQEPFALSDAQFVFTLTYPLTFVPERLSGRSAFYAEYRNEHFGAQAGDKLITYLSVVGKKTVQFELPLNKPEFELSLKGMARSPVSRWMERARDFFVKISSNAFFWLALVLLCVQGFKRWQWKKRKPVL